jgi:hypothetical protein
MRTPSDLPSRQARERRVGDRGRVLLIAAAVVVVVFLVSARALSGFFIDYLWHDSVQRSDVFWGVLGSKVFLFVVAAAVFITIAVVNLLIADRLAPSTFSANMHPIVERFHEIFGRRLRLVRFGPRCRVRTPVRASGDEPLAGVDALPQQPVVRGRGPAVRHGHRLLHLPAPVHHLRARLALRLGHLRHAAGGPHPHPERRRPDPAAETEDPPRHEGAPRRAAGAPRAAEGR